MGFFKTLPVAIVGADCRLPGASGLSEYWSLISEGRTAISKVPDSRLERSLYYTETVGELGKSYSDLAGLVEETPFDRHCCPISDALIERSDLVHLRMLEVCVGALRDSGLDPFQMPTARSGVYIGHSGGSCLAGDMAFGSYAAEVAHLLRDEEAFGRWPAALRDRAAAELQQTIRRQMPSRSPEYNPNLAAHDVSVLVNRALDLNGPAVAIDAACASSMIAIAQAILALQCGQIDLAIAGGCSFSKWYGMVLFSQAQSISGTGSRPFDEDADGLISSDGYAAVVLKTLPRALAEGDRILGVIRSFSVASDGKGKSLWAPRREGQIDAVRRAYSEDVSPSSLQYIECHATSTKVGDTTELTALADALRDSVPSGRKIPIGSVKGNIGHTLECAGIAGVLKVLLALNHGVIPPQPNIRNLNPDIPWDDIPLYVPTSAQPWLEMDQHPVRRAAVNAFGIGGLNSHFVIDDRPEPALKEQVSVLADLAAAPTATEPEPIAVVGIGVVLPEAKSVGEFWALLASGRSALSEVPPDRWNKDLFRTDARTTEGDSRFLGGFIRDFQFDWRKHRVPPKQIANANPLQFMLLDAAEQALQDAGHADRPLDRNGTSVIVGTVFGGDFSCQMQMGLRLPHIRRELERILRTCGLDEGEVPEFLDQYGECLLTKMPALRDETGSFTSSTLASRLTKAFDFRGGAWAIDGSDVSSLAALEVACELLRTGHSNAVLCASGQRSMDVTVYESLGMDASLPTKQEHPGREGSRDRIFPGEGVGVLLLKRLSDAERDGDCIRAVITDVTISYAQRDVSEGQSGNVRRVIGENLFAENRTVDVVELAWPLGPEAAQQELDTVEESWSRPDGAPVGLASTVNQFGHLFGTSGMVATIKAILEMEHGVVPAMVDRHRSSAAISDSRGTFRLVKAPLPLGVQGPNSPRRAIVSNLAPNGLLGHVVLENQCAVAHRQLRQKETHSETTMGGDSGLSDSSCTDSSTRMVPQSSQTGSEAETPSRASNGFLVVRMGAATLTEMEARIDNTLAAGHINSDDGFAPTETVRLAIIGQDHDDLLKKLRVTQGKLAEIPRRHVLADNGVQITEVAGTAAKVAVLFSGQGAQYTGMFQDWVSVWPALRQATTEMNNVLSGFGLPAVETLCWEEEADLGTNVLNTQLGVLVGDLLAWSILRELGLRPDVISGHSYGEFPALVAAGAWDFEQAVRATIARTKAVEGCRADGAGMLSTSAPAEIVEAILQREQSPCDIACRNAPNQTILAGHFDELKRMAVALKDRGFASREINVPRPFHSRLLKDARQPLEEHLQTIAMKCPEIPYVSSSSLRQLTEPDDLRQTLVRQLTEPVRYHELIDQLISGGVQFLFEAGPKQILTRLHRQIIGNRPVHHCCVDARPRDVEEQLLRLQLLMECASLAEAEPSAFPEQPSPEQQSVPVRTSRGRDSFSDSKKVSGSSLITEARKEDGPAQRQASRPIQPAEIIWFDATAKRRDKMRESSRTLRTEASASSRGHDTDQPGGFSAQEHYAETSQNQVHERRRETIDVTDDRPAFTNGNGNSTSYRTESSYQEPVLSQKTVTQDGSRLEPASVPAASAVPVADHQGTITGEPIDSFFIRDKLEAFVLDFVVEQTGYPPELVEMDVDLEADLGIDSIRKAQLLGEIAENFELKEQALKITDMSLDELPTLGTIVDFFVNVGAPDASVQSAIAPPPVGTDSSGYRPARFELNVPQPEPQRPETDQWNSSDGGSSLSRAELERFTINFVVEQTGYPDELVELEADLEADLGIDSIRKAQLLGEIVEQFGLNRLELAASEMSLDDFPTLESVVSYFVQAANADALPADAETVPPGTQPVRPEPDLVSPAPVAAAPASRDPAPSVLIPEETRPDGTPGKSVPRSEVERFAVDYVVDETGYPEELVEMDADLEADLGIDSIRKARLLGEIAERFELTDRVTVTSEMSLDDFPTLTSMVDFFCEATNDSNASITPVLADQDSAADTVEVPPVSSPQVTFSDTATAESETTMQRYVLRSVAAPLVEAHQKPWSYSGSVLLVGDSTTAEPLRDLLQSQGHPVRHLAVEDDWKSAVSRFEALWNAEPVSHMILLTSDHCRPAEQWRQQRSRELFGPYFLCQRWMQLRAESTAEEQNSPAFLCAVTRMGGDFGLSGRIGNVTGGALTGLLKGISRECPQLNIKVFDAPSDEPSRLVVEAIRRELTAETSQIEVGCIRGHRHQLRMVLRPVSMLKTRAVNISGAWIVTGGARGVTARVARELGHQPGVKLHLLGRSPHPDIPEDWKNRDGASLAELKSEVFRQAASNGRKPIDAWTEVIRAIELDRSLTELRLAGVDVTYHSCDVSCRDAVEAMLREIRSEQLPITGIVHGAGIEAAARFERKNAASVEATVASKVDGAIWLWELTAEDPLQYFIGFGSTSGRFGGLGQTDYSMSSDLLCRLGSLFATERPRCRVVGIHWPPWDEIGMAARPESRFALEASGLTFMPPDEGVRHVLNELFADSLDTEVAFVDRIWDVSEREQEQDTHLATTIGRLGSAITRMPYVDGIVEVTQERIVVERRFDPTQNAVLYDHQFQGILVVPGAVLMELCCEAAGLLAASADVTQVEDFQILNGVRFYGEQPKTLTATAIHRPDGRIDCQVTGMFSDQKNRVVDPARTYATAVIHVSDAAPVPAPPIVAPLPADWTVLQQSTDPARIVRTDVGTVFHGPALSALNSVSMITDHGAWFRIRLSQDGTNGPRADSGEIVPPAVIDAVLQACDVLLHRLHGRAHLPSEVRCVRKYRETVDLPEDMFVQVELASTDTKGATLNATVVDSLARPVYELDAIRMTSISAEQSPVVPGIPTKPPMRPLVSMTRLAVDGDSLTAELDLDPQSIPFLSHHRLRGIPILPTVIALELIGECAEQLAGGEPISRIQNLDIRNGIQFPGKRPRQLQVRCQREGTRVRAEIYESAQAAQPAITAMVDIGASTGTGSPVEWEPPESWTDYEYPEGKSIVHGPPFQSLRKVTCGRIQGWAELERPSDNLISDRGRFNWLFEPAVLDGALVACGTDTWFWTGQGRIEIPVGIKDIRVHSEIYQEQGPFRVRFIFTGQTSTETTYNLTFYNMAGVILLEIWGYRSQFVEMDTEGLV
jgi:acyl transferase domain-containing protein/NAD(P)-dependent dehydrogenase (short-subunit alcohol dehydrogenase family)/acyl carrier protein